jgi:hypothetical protein
MLTVSEVVSKESRTAGDLSGVCLQSPLSLIGLLQTCTPDISRFLIFAQET